MVWEVTRTVRVRLDVPDDRKSEAENAVYDDLRKEIDYLHANVQKAIKRATDDIDNCVDRLADSENTSKPDYDTFSIVYDKRAATYYRDKVSLATVNGRVECEYDLPDDAEGTPHGEYLLNDGYSFSTSTVHYDSEADEFYLHAVMKRELDVAYPEKAEHSKVKVLGVDCNVDDHIAVTSTGAFVGNADFFNHRRNEFEKRRASLQQTGTRSAHLSCQRIGDRFGRWTLDAGRWTLDAGVGTLYTTARKNWSQKRNDMAVRISPLKTWDRFESVSAMARSSSSGRSTHCKRWLSPRLESTASSLTL